MNILWHAAESISPGNTSAELRTTHPLNFLLHCLLTGWESICLGNKFDLLDIATELSSLIRQIKTFSLPDQLSSPLWAKFVKCTVNIKSISLVPFSSASFFIFCSEGRHWLYFVYGWLFAAYRSKFSSQSRICYSGLQSGLIHHARINNNASILYAEATAILCAFEYIEEFRFSRSIIATDYLSILRCLESWLWRTDYDGHHLPIIYKIKKLVTELKSSSSLIQIPLSPRPQWNWRQWLCRLLHEEGGSRFSGPRSKWKMRY